MTETAHGTLSFQTATLEIAELGPLSPLPPVTAWDSQPFSFGDGVPEELQAAGAFGGVPNIYPYQLQDGYTRQRERRDVAAVVLENSRLRAVFLPELGGRLWELLDKRTGKQLLHSPSTLQFANLALRDAWFAGGIEWNIGTRGHSPTTCSPLHTAVVDTPEGHRVLRMWEFDRLREVVFQVDAWLPEDSAVLFVAVRIRNPNELPVPMYWWSNAAIPESPATRVIAPAEEAFATGYPAGISRVRPANHGGIDATWPARNPHAADYFFDLQPDQRRWIAAADHDGDGLAMLSSRRLRGRKLFAWGEGPGGRRWQEWLSPAGGTYAEIQAGLAQTQFEHLSMPGGAEWSWLEAYGNAGLDPASSHSEDYSAAVAHAQEAVDGLLPEHALDGILEEAVRNADIPPTEYLLPGSGWGALEDARRRHAGRPWINDAGTPFPQDTITEEQRPWLELLDGKGFQGAGSFAAGGDFEEFLAGEGTRASMFHLATMKHARQDIRGAVDLYRQALAAAPQGGSAAGSSRDGAAPDASAAEAPEIPEALTRRGLGLALIASGDIRQGLDELAHAVSLATKASSLDRASQGPVPVASANIPLLHEAMALHIRHGDPRGALALAADADAPDANAADAADAGEAPAEGAAVGRVLFLKSLALARSGRRAEAADILRAGVEVADLREGENSISELWLEVCPGEPVPSPYQFGMQ
ncbi:DUF5107 domain-containing protein [Micrococcaceae bacterium Sec5.7]